VKFAILDERNGTITVIIIIISDSTEQQFD
jgi:hypothetical protein